MQRTLQFCTNFHVGLIFLLDEQRTTYVIRSGGARVSGARAIDFGTLSSPSISPRSLEVGALEVGPLKPS